MRPPSTILLFTPRMFWSSGTIPGPIMMGVAFDNSCLLWLPLTCGDSSGSCSFYDSRALSINFVILLTAVSCVSVVAMIIANVMYRPFDTVGSITMEVSFNGDVSDDVSDAVIEDQKEAVETKSISDEKTKDGADTVIWTTEEKPAIQPSDVINLAFVLDDNLETSQLWHWRIVLYIECFDDDCFKTIYCYALHL